MKVSYTSALSIFILLFSSCAQKEGCTEFGAENYDPDAIMNDGSCVKVYDKFVGDYIVDADCFNTFYQMSIEKTGDDYEVIIEGLADTLPNVNAEISGKNITIRQQEVAHHVLLEGAGTIIDGGLSLSYHVRDSRSGETVLQDCLQWCSKL